MIFDLKISDRLLRLILAKIFKPAFGFGACNKRGTATLNNAQPVRRHLTIETGF